MAHIAFVSAPAPGHVNPTLPLVEELVRRGHRVSYATGPATVDGPVAAGAAPVVLPSELPPDLDSRADYTADQLAVTLEHFLADARTAFPVLSGHFTADRPDVVCYDSVTFTGRMLANLLDAPEVALVPTFAENESFSATRVYLPPSFDHAHPRLVAAVAAMGEFASGHEFLADPNLMFGYVAPTNVVFIPREFQPSGEGFDGRFHFVGPSLGGRPEREAWTPRTADPVLLISLGTVFNRRPDFFRTCVEAFGGTPWQVVMSIGGLDPAELGEVPPNVEVAARVPQVAVLRHARAFVTHAGMNSVMEALYHDVPLVAVPRIPEQRAVAKRAEELGVGVVPADLSVEGLRAAVASAERCRRAAAELGAVVRGAGGAVAAADAVEARLTGRP
ncbi:macrolide family glycosyltransferase [Saccharothrix australiensis]|uniref:MGT family glycosyltransferase n=1 Tax=Saccharothrix australiensis TaxID=2072 RepID=A0A495W3K3_9PSEU|nr:macrolide family glycosyltransferase [Saccharothrix australiensis]RKT56256.1 MGT family glycosyltransferase [Saccharothrix australiensis]